MRTRSGGGGHGDVVDMSLPCRGIKHRSLSTLRPDRRLQAGMASSVFVHRESRTRAKVGHCRGLDWLTNGKGRTRSPRRGWRRENVVHTTSPSAPQRHTGPRRERIQGSLQSRLKSSHYADAKMYRSVPTDSNRASLRTNGVSREEGRSGLIFPSAHHYDML